MTTLPDSDTEAIAIPTVNPFAKGDKNGAAPHAHAAGRGAATGCDLSDVSALCPPLERDQFFRARPAYSTEAAKLSLELAYVTYTLELEPWIEAGWYDLSVQIDNSLHSGLVTGEAANSERMRAALSTLRLHRARAALKSQNPISQVINALRQRERSDTVKALVMAHRCDAGKYLIAIGFMGTGKRFYDWISNFRFTTEGGFHKGFMQLCEYFEQSEAQIVFPEIAAELGVERLTLGMILEELKRGDSRFRLWMAGHSQGGAIMQIYTHRLINELNAQPQNILGYGFASPTVATSRTVHDPAAYPLYHVLNSDDFVPRMGATMHLGLCLQYRADDALRHATYSWSELPAGVAAREKLFPYLVQMVDTPSILMYSVALIQCALAEYGEEAINSLMSRWWSIKPIDHLFSYAGDRAMSLAERLIHHAKEGYLAVSGKPMDELELKLLTNSMRDDFKDMPGRRIMGALLEYLGAPHHIMRGENDGAYSYIVKHGLHALRPFIWTKSHTGEAHKRFAEAAHAAAPHNAPAPRRARHVPPAKPAKAKQKPANKRSTGISAKRAVGR